MNTGLLMPVLRRYWIADASCINDLEQAIDLPIWPEADIGLTILSFETPVLENLDELTKGKGVQVISLGKKDDVFSIIIKAIKEDAVDYVQIAHVPIFDFGAAFDLFREKLASEKPTIASGSMMQFRDGNTELIETGDVHPDCMWVKSDAAIEALQNLSSDDCALPNLASALGKHVAEAHQYPVVLGGFLVKTCDVAMKEKAKLASLYQENDQLRFERNRTKTDMRRKNEVLSTKLRETRDELKAAKAYTIRSGEVDGELTQGSDMLAARFTSVAHLMIPGHSDSRWPRPPYGAMAAAIVATQCGFWSQAVALWRGQFYRGHAPQLAALCGVEAGYKSGCHGFADQMAAQLNEDVAAVNKWVDETEAVRKARKNWFSLSAAERDKQLCEGKGKPLLVVRLFRDALRFAGRTGLPDEDAAKLRLAAWEGLGAYHRLAEEFRHDHALAQDPEFSGFRDICASKLAEWDTPLTHHITQFAVTHPGARYLGDAPDISEGLS